MPTVLEDLERGHGLSIDRTEVDVRRVFRVSGLVLAPELQLMEAETQATIPEYLDAYPLPAPGVPDVYAKYRSLQAMGIESRPDGPNAALVTVTYSTPEFIGGTITTGGGDGADAKQVRFSTREKTTTRDRTNTAMSMDPPVSLSGYDPYLSEAVVPKAVGVLGFERDEGSPPTARMRDLVGRVNNATIGPYAAGTLLLSGIDANNTPDGIWPTVYSFEYDPDGWEHTDRYHDPTGRVPDDAVEETFEVLDEGDFSALGLDFTD